MEVDFNGLNIGNIQNIAKIEKLRFGVWKDDGGGLYWIYME